MPAVLQLQEVDCQDQHVSTASTQRIKRKGFCAYNLVKHHWIMIGNVNFSKFKRYIFQPDTGNKYLSLNPFNVGTLLKQKSIYVKYVFTNHATYNPVAIKAI